MSEIDLKTRQKIGMSVAKTQFEFDLIPMLERAYNQGVTEFRLVCRGDNFYIHPMGVSGETVDVDWGKSESFCEEISE